MIFIALFAKDFYIDHNLWVKTDLYFPKDALESCQYRNDQNFHNLNNDQQNHWTKIKHTCVWHALSNRRHQWLNDPVNSGSYRVVRRHEVTKDHFCDNQN